MKKSIKKFKGNERKSQSKKSIKKVRGKTAKNIRNRDSERKALQKELTQFLENEVRKVERRKSVRQAKNVEKNIKPLRTIKGRKEKDSFNLKSAKSIRTIRIENLAEKTASKLKQIDKLNKEFDLFIKKKPKGVIITTVSKYRKRKSISSIPSAPELVINKANLKGLIKGVIENMESLFTGWIDQNTNEYDLRKKFKEQYLKEIFIRFIY